MRDLVTAFPYIVRYRVVRETVRVLRVRHTSHRPTTTVLRRSVCPGWPETKTSSSSFMPALLDFRKCLILAGLPSS